VQFGPADILEDTNPHVRLHPDCFVAVRATMTDDGSAPPIEDASARPGEKRNTRR